MRSRALPEHKIAGQRDGRWKDAGRWRLSTILLKGQLACEGDYIKGEKEDEEEYWCLLLCCLDIRWLLD